MKNNHYYFLSIIPKMKIFENNLFNFFLSLFIILSINNYFEFYHCKK